MAKKSKAIKQLNKRVKKLNARIDKMSKQIKGLLDTADSTTSNTAEELAQEAWTGSKFTEEEVEISDEITEEAEEIADILEKR